MRWSDWCERSLREQEAFEKCWAHSPLRVAARPNFTLPFTRCRYCRTPPAHRCPRQQRQRVTEGTAMAPWNGPNQIQYVYDDVYCYFARGEFLSWCFFAGQLLIMCSHYEFNWTYVFVFVCFTQSQLLIFLFHIWNGMSWYGVWLHFKQQNLTSNTEHNSQY